MQKGQKLIKRISFIILVFSILWSILFLKSAYLQILPNKKLSDLKSKLFEGTVTLTSRRGTIYDRYGKELAISIPSQSLFVDPGRLEKPYFAAKKLSLLLNTPHKSLLKNLLNKEKRFVWVARHLDKEKIKIIKSWKLKGLYFLKENKRFYTNKKSLSQVLGFTGVEEQGLEGIEKEYDSFLKGNSQKIFLKRDAKGRPLFLDFSPFITQVSGFDIYLTIDSDLQFYLEKKLEQALINSKAKTAMGVILSAETSEVLAMVNIPNYNPNEPSKSAGFHRRNRVVTDMFEPGSVLKTFTIISALKKGIQLSTRYPSQTGELKVGNITIKEADQTKKFKPFLNLSDILKFSSNVGSASLALDIGSETLRKNLSDFGFGEKTGIDFPGESRGLLRDLPWKPIETATISFGHGVAATALQVVNSYTAIANGGLLKKPFLVRKIRKPYTGEEINFKSQTLRRALSREEARILTLMLISVTEEKGTGLQASVPGYFVSGKTGTAQKVDLKNKGYKQGEYISSFAGFIPAHNPKFVIYLVIDGAKDNFYASSLVAPLFSEVAFFSVRKADLSPTLINKEEILLSSQHKTKTEEKKQNNQKPDRQIASIQRVPNLVGLTLREAVNEIEGMKFELKFHNSGKITHTIPGAGELAPKNKKIEVFLK